MNDSSDDQTRSALAPAPAQWRDRILGEGWEDPEQLLANPKNWRIHPKAQEDALEAVLAAVGWVQRIIVNQRTGFVVDGHLRVALALRKNEPRVPVLYVDLTSEEEDLILTTIDPIGAMAGTDREKLAELLGGIRSDDERMLLLLQEIRSKNLDLGGEQLEVEAANTGAAQSLIEKFGVPPFSVLDARQGYWQDRKRAWLALGIKSELGRGAGGGFEKQGAVVPAGGNVKQKLLNQRARQKASRQAAPGGSPRPAAKLGKNGRTKRGDGRGKELSKR